MKSIISNSNYCYICGKPKEHTHHCLEGNHHRQLCDKYGLTIPICASCHNAIHTSANKFDRDMANSLKKIAQEKWESTYGNREEFIKIFRKSYL